MKLVPYYDDPSYDYPGYWQGREYEDQSDKLAISSLLALIPPNGSVIDIGGGFGRLVPAYQKHFSKIVIADSSQKMLSQAKKRFVKDDIVFVKAYAEKIPYPDNNFDAAIMVRTFHHLSNPEKAIEETARIIKPGGYLILEFANKLHFKSLFKSFSKLDFCCLANLEPVTVGKMHSGKIPFLNHHPKSVKKLLEKNNFQIVKALSVSNFRSPMLKKILPLSLIMSLEKLAQKTPFYFYTGPSVFYLARKICL